MDECECEECGEPVEEEKDKINIITPPDNRTDVQLELTEREHGDGFSVIVKDYIVKIGSSEPFDVVVEKAHELFGEMLDGRAEQKRDRR